MGNRHHLVRRGLLALALLIVLGGGLAVGGGLWLARQQSEPTVPMLSFNEALTVSRTTPAGTAYSYNASLATFALDVLPDDAHCGRLFPSHAAALAYAREQRLATLPSLGLVQAKLKARHDELVAQVELYMQRHKQPALTRLLTRLLPLLEGECAEEASLAAAYVAAALQEGGASPTLPPSLTPLMAELRESFATHPAASQPVGIWDSSPELQRLFRQDRLLSGGIPGPSAPAQRAALLLVATLRDTALATAFARCQAVDAALTNPPDILVTRQVLPLLGDAPLTPAQLATWQQELATRFGESWRLGLIGYATSKEGAMIRRLGPRLQDDRLPLLPAIRDAVRDGSLSLAPTDASGWYDWQWYALETLLLPEQARETAKLEFSRRYRQRLDDLFGAIATKDRETHLKSLPVDIMGGGADTPPEEIELAPQFTVEPLMTVYLRWARGYALLSERLAGIVGDPELEAPVDELARLCYGLHERLAYDLGVTPLHEPNELPEGRRERAMAEADAWLEGLAEDPDLAADARVVAPLFQPRQHATRYWATFGVRLQRVQYVFVDPPALGATVTARLVPAEVYLTTDTMGEFTREGAELLTRADFRRQLDALADWPTARRHFAVVAPAPARPWLPWAAGTFGALLALAALLRWGHRIP